MRSSRYLMLTTVGVFLSLTLQITHDDGRRESVWLPLFSLSTLLLRWWRITAQWQQLRTEITRLSKRIIDKFELYRLIAGIGVKSVLYGAGVAV